MKNKLLQIILLLNLLVFSTTIFAQIPDFGTLANFSFFTSAGALSNTAVSQINGNIGSHVGAITGFEAPTFINGTIYNANGVTAQGVADLQAAYIQLNSIPATNTTHTPVFGSGETVLPGVYSIAGAGSVAGNLTLDAQGDPGAIFIFKLAGAFTTGAGSTIILSNGASACNVFWVAEGAVAMAALTTMKGTLIAHPGAASMGASCNLEGRMFSTAGAVSVYGVAATVPVACSITSIWTGNDGTADWFTPGNWQGGVPRSTSQAFIPGALLPGRVFPVIDTGIAKVDILTIQMAASVIVISTIQINGSIVNNGIFDVKDGTVEMAGSSSQTIDASTFTYNTLKNLIVSNNVTLSSQDTITGSLSFGNVNNKIFNSAGLLTLKSTAAGTANIADITNAGSNSGNTIAGKVKVERYIPAYRAWRLLTAPVDIIGGQTINAAWQEGADINNPTGPGGNPTPGYGTHITGGLIEDGFDQGVNDNPGIKKFENGDWSYLSNINILISSQPGYFLFLRGDRSIDLTEGTGSVPTSTVLRVTGTVKTGNQDFPGTRTGFTLLGNPYASRINFHTISKGTAPDTYYQWDPRLKGTKTPGGFITFTWNGNNYSVSPIPASPFNLDGGIESGSAFFVDNTAGNTITIKETDKVGGSTNVFRPLDALHQLRTTLYAYDVNGNKSMEDGVLFLYSQNYSNAVNSSDARKLTDGSESLGIQNGPTNLCIEKRQLITSADTLQFSMTRMKITSYQLEFIGENLTTPGLDAFLEDGYLKTSTPIDLNNTASFNFSISEIPGSSSPTRFRIVFKKQVIPPVFFTIVKAFKQSDDIQVMWKVDNDKYIRQFEVERSVNGRQFEKSASVIPGGNNSNTAGYSWIDEHPFAGNNFYRIKSISINGVESYSSVVSVNTENKNEMQVFPNPISNNVVSLQFNKMPAGIYNIKLINNLGQVVMEKEVLHAAGVDTEALKLNKGVTKGIYNLTIVEPDNSILSLKVFN